METPILDLIINTLLQVVVFAGLLLFCWSLASSERPAEATPSEDLSSAGESTAVSERTEVRFEQEENQNGLSAESPLPKVKMTNTEVKSFIRPGKQAVISELVSAAQQPEATIIVDEAVQLADLGVEPEVVETIIQQSANQVRHIPTQPKTRKRRCTVPSSKASKGFA